MTEEIMTINEAPESSTEEGTGDLVPTMDVVPAASEEPSDETLNTDKAEGGEKVEGKEEAKPEEKPEEKVEAKKEPEEKPVKPGDENRFDKHPRWKEMQRKASKVESLEAKIADLEKRLTAPAKQSPAFKNIFELQDDDLRDQFDENPKEFLKNYGMQIRESVLSAVNETYQGKEAEAQERQYHEGLKRTFDGFGEKHEDFWEQWDDGNGPIKQFMDENPGHNAISAYLILNNDRQEQETQAKIDAAVKDAVEKAKSEWAKNQKAKRYATVLGSGPAGAPAGGESDGVLKDTNKHGGFAAVAAERIRRMRGGLN